MCFDNACRARHDADRPPFARFRTLGRFACAGPRSRTDCPDRREREREREGRGRKKRHAAKSLDCACICFSAAFHLLDRCFRRANRREPIQDRDWRLGFAVAAERRLNAERGSGGKHPIKCSTFGPLSCPSSRLLARRSTLINEFIENSRESMLASAEPRNHPRGQKKQGGALSGGVYIRKRRIGRRCLLTGVERGQTDTERGQGLSRRGHRRLAPSLPAILISRRNFLITNFSD